MLFRKYQVIFNRYTGHTSNTSRTLKKNYMIIKQKITEFIILLDSHIKYYHYTSVSIAINAYAADAVAVVALSAAATAATAASNAAFAALILL